MHYTPNSKYYSRELSFREQYKNDPSISVNTETHYAGWKARDKYAQNIVDRELLGFRPFGRNTERVWIVARRIES